MSDMVTQTLEIIRKLRQFDKFDVDRKSFNIIHGSLDLIGDTEFAICEFSSVYKSGSLGYLSIFGLFQALQTQQDAVWALCGAISISESTIKIDLEDIRRMRALTVAHPINPHPENRQDKVARTGIISRGHLLDGQFGYMTTYDDGRPSEFKEVDLTEPIERQSKYVAVELGRVRDELIRRKEEHYKEFRAVKLAAVFHPSTDWMMGHVEEAIDDKTKIFIAQEDLHVIEEYLERYINLLRKRGKIHENHIKFSVQPVLHCIKRLKKYFEPYRSSISKMDAGIFADWLRSSLRELKEYAEAIDKEYENKEGA